MRFGHFFYPMKFDYSQKGARFGPNNAHENRPGSFQSDEDIGCQRCNSMSTDRECHCHSSSPCPGLLATL